MRRTITATIAFLMLCSFATVQPASAETSYTETYTTGENAGVLFPCSRGANLGGVCIDLTGKETAPFRISVSDAIGKQVAGSFEFGKIECWPDGRCFWVQIAAGDFCDNNDPILSSDYLPTGATLLEVRLGPIEALRRCVMHPGQNFTGGTTGTITATFAGP